MNNNKIEFKQGIYKLNNDNNFNYQLNRIIMWNGGRLKDIEKIFHKIKDSETWKKELIELGDKAKKEKKNKRVNSIL